MVLTLAGVALVCGQGAVAQQKEPDWSKVQIKVTKVSGNIYMLEGQGGNIAASVAKMASSSWTISSLRWRKKSRPR